MRRLEAFGGEQLSQISSEVSIKGKDLRGQVPISRNSIYARILLTPRRLKIEGRK